MEIFLTRKPLPDDVGDQEVVEAIRAIPEHRSANIVVDLYNTVQMVQSFPSTAQAADGGVAITSGGSISSLSGVMIGDGVDMRDSDTNTQLFVGGLSYGSGPLIIGVQTAPSATSGDFTDPTSGLATFPGAFRSGGFLIIGSGPASDTRLGIFGSGQSGFFVRSGFFAASHFQRPHRYARIIHGSGFFEGTLHAGFIGSLKTTGSGGGYSASPGSGAVSV